MGKTVTLILPCLNEEASLPTCIRLAKKGLEQLKKSGYQTELLIVDNGSTDRSQAIIKDHNIALVTEFRRGYGSVYKKGIRQAQGEILILADTDGTYDVSNLFPFVRKIEEGFDLVLGSRFLGTIQDHAMPFFNRYVGNPLLTGMLNIFYHGSISDAHTGMRAVRKKTAEELHLNSTGMEFASEMIVKALLQHVSTAEIPITYAPRIGKSKLKPFTDALRHIKFLLLYAPTYVIVFPGLLFFVLGLILHIRLYLAPLTIGRIVLDTHTLLFSTVILQLGLFITLTGILARQYTEKTLKIKGGLLGRFLLKLITGEQLLRLGLLCLLGGFLLSLTILGVWIRQGFSVFSMFRETIGAITVISIGFTLLFSSFLFSLFPRE